MAPDLTLNSVKAKVRERRASDFLSDEQIEEVKKANLKGKKPSKFNQIDAYIAEILARFGYDTYVAWKNGDIDEKIMTKYILAERAREAKNRYILESVIVGAMAGANNRDKHGQAPKSLKTAVQILKSEKKLAEGK